MKIVTFYSYKGGVGRTLACANFGLYLAKTGQRVVLLDMDFEAPGLDSKFDALQPEQFRSGMLDHFYAFVEARKFLEIEGYEVPLSPEITEAGGGLWLIPAGDYTGREYYTKLSSLNWEMLTASADGIAFCLDLVRRIKEKFNADVLAVDSRTGLTEIGGLCTQVWPDSVVLLTSTSNESLAGTRRIHNRILNSPFVKARPQGRTSVEVRIVVSRMPRVDNLSEFQEYMLEKTKLDVSRLYFLFDERDLSLDEYLALDRFSQEHPAILDDYVELFASFNPEGTRPYIVRRLETFRSAVTLRTPAENASLIQELVTLFPRPEVHLEAARYYRLAKGGDVESLSFYVKYIESEPHDEAVLTEFVNLAASISLVEVEFPHLIAKYLNRYGIEKLPGHLLSWYVRFTDDTEVYQMVVDIIEQDRHKLTSSAYRQTYFESLQKLGEWHKIIDMASERDARERTTSLVVAEAFASVGDIDELSELLSDFEVRTPAEGFKALYLIYKVMPVPHYPAIRRSFPLIAKRAIFRRLLLEPGLYHRLSSKSDADFGKWLNVLREQLSLDELEDGERIL